MSATKIEWADSVWNPVTGCTPISEGCDNCYARRMAQRLAGRYGYPNNGGFSVTLRPERLSDPMQWNKPRRVFCVSMGDLFHDEVPDSFISKVMVETQVTPRHTYLILTKRPDRMSQFMLERYQTLRREKPYPNVWVGVTVENQQRADERIPILLQIPAAKRFVSVEPMLEDINIRPYMGCTGMPDCQFCETGNKLDWVICGGETGRPRARQLKASWVRSIRDQCQSAGVPFFFKGCGDNPVDDGIVGGMGSLIKRKSRRLEGREWSEVPE
ncbi:MAG: phage Gp37/Gp68 family protein [Syntrophobacter sp.]